MNIYSGLWLGVMLGIALVALDVSIVLRYTVLARRAMPRWVDFLPTLALLTLVGNVFAGLALNPLMILFMLPMYLATIAIFLATLARALRRNRPVPAARLRMPKAVGALLCAALVLISTVRQTEMYAYTFTFADRFDMFMREPSEIDLSERSWSEAFGGLIEKLKVEYPFSAWKRIDWDALYAEFAPRIADAEARHDSKAYYRALREFAWRIPDGHVGIDGDDQGLAQAEVGGSYGLTLLPLDDGRLVVRDVTANGPAAQAGMQIGAEIVAWNAAPAQDALAHTSIIWSAYPPATTEGIRLQQARFLGRGPIAAAAQVTYRNRIDNAPHTTTLTAIAADLTETAGPELPELVKSAVESRVLPSGYGYIRIKYELPTLLGFPDTLVRQAVARFAAANVPGIIVDVRNNIGGESGLTAGLLAAFQPRERVFQYLGVFDPATKNFRPATQIPLMVFPAQPQYQGRVAVLIDHYSHSAAEDIAQELQDLPNGIVVGMSGSAGAGGTSEKDVLLPGGYTFALPRFQSLDGNFAIQIDSDYTGNGGVTPDVRVPLDDATIDALSAGRDVVLERAESALREQAAAWVRLDSIDR
jgi:carboxyl-terminal processing protease